jgi:hypothetical protein
VKEEIQFLIIHNSFLIIISGAAVNIFLYSGLFSKL